MERILPSFFARDPVACARDLVACARDLVGATFHWHGCEARVVETEAYAEKGDSACHASFRPSARAFMAAHAPGTAYVYLNYGIHWLFNILVKGQQGAGFVLFRALEPISGIERMTDRRGSKSLRELCSGPGKLTRALGIDGASHGADFLLGQTTSLRPGVPGTVLSGPRVGINRARELPWRFFEAGNPCVSRAKLPI